MTDSGPGHDEGRGRQFLGVLGILAGMAIVAHLVAVAYLPNPASSELVGTYQANQSVYLALILTAVVFATLLLIFLVGLAKWVSYRAPLLAMPAALAMALGVVLVVLAVVVSNGALSAASSTTSDLGPSYQGSATFEADFWANMMSWISNFGTITLGVGMIIFGWVPWNSGKIPNWLLAVLIGGGIVGVTGVLAGSDLLSGIPFFVLTLWCLVTGYLLVRPLRLTPAVSGAN